MKLKTLFLTIICILLGVAIGKFLLTQYSDKEELEIVSKSQNDAYFFQQGVYSSMESMKENTINIPYYIYSIIDDKYYVYVAIIHDKANIEKVKGYFDSLKYNIYVKEMNIENDNFMIVLSQYEDMLKDIDDNKRIGTIISQILAKYEEVVNQDENQN